MASDSGKKTRIHAIGYAHLDPIWLWDWREGCREMLATVRSALLRLNEYPDFKVTFSSAGLYFWIKKYAPDLFARIKQFNFQGRWEIVGGWWIESDVNLPDGESLIRQGIYGKRFFKRYFGCDCLVGFNPDSFGHPITLPKILKQLGQFYYVFMRPDQHEKYLPGDVILWEGDDGSQVIASRIPFSYNCDAECEEKLQKTIQDARKEDSTDDVLFFYGVGDHGGGPTKRSIEFIQSQKCDTPELKIDYGTILEYFMRLENNRHQMMLVKDELRHHARGCYAVHTNLKRMNRRCEYLLLTAEKWCTVVFQILKRDIPWDAFSLAWENVLLHQFHDVITGTSIRQGLDDARMFLNESLAIASRELFDVLRYLASHIVIHDEQGEFIVFNSLPWPRTGPIELEYMFDPAQSQVFIDINGKIMHLQDVQRSELTESPRRKWLFFDTLPAMGYKTYRWSSEKTKLDLEILSDTSILNIFSLEADQYSLENKFWRLEFDPATGQLVKLNDNEWDIDILKAPAAIARVIDDPWDTWAHGVARFEQEVGLFSQPEFRLLENGPLRATLYIKTHYQHSHFIQYWRIYRTDPRIEIVLDFEWHEHHKMLKYCFPLKMQNQFFTSEQPYGTISRYSDGTEQPLQKWLDVSGNLIIEDENLEYGVSFINSGISAFSLENDELRLTLCRSPIYAHHDPAKPDPNKIYEYSDQGHHEIKLLLLPHPGHGISAESIQLAYDLNTPVYSIIDYPHAGYLPKTASFLEISAPNVIGTVLKKAESADELIIRCYEVEGKQTHTHIKLPYWRLEANIEIGPHVLKTYRLLIRDGALRIYESNALEE
ncbi:alpha-mannosidase [candidate division KSB1 bacterium]|nr:alpha-mannosidase [candidate division KSB1 bacterium]